MTMSDVLNEPPGWSAAFVPRDEGAGADEEVEPFAREGSGRAARTLPLVDLDLLVTIIPSAQGDLATPVRMQTRSLDHLSETVGSLGRTTRAAGAEEPAQEAASASHRAATCDAVIGRLAQALDWIDDNPSPHGAVVGDAIRLSIAARMAAILPGEEPAGDPDASVGTLPKWRLRRVRDFVEAHLAEKITLADLARVAGLSRMHFAAQFRASTRLRPHEYVLRRRISRARKLLKAPDRSLADVALAVGFQTQAHFTTVFRDIVGDTPHRWRMANTQR
ncbi:helix-turn-helix domain-containing protein [Aurantimonas sp. 22II-16-19i]|uniref:helix-turn-helix domain-containing protein n=1 Tax=Aurantimonas sp. 22II-16-19i TaxID=1317114 RepID=UPI0009F7F178|nr:helix-turn-helix domain-containing protein [Aurantimonas sp. 22II-16-19i]ORE90358.1 transcriptional regulator [Aurantimonas sp. 22II-16-19i]